MSDFASAGKVTADNMGAVDLVSILDDLDELSEFFALGAVPLLSCYLQNNERSYDNAKAARCWQI